MDCKDYYIGLDIGTDSIGWAVTDPAYEIGKFKGNAMWGIELFDEAKTAADYRTFRSARRRRQRAKDRVTYLEMIFNEEIAKVDIAFFRRLKESAFWQEDKTQNTKYSLFADKDFTDKDYFKKYPTVYHLQKDLIESKEKKDVRLVYLAILKIMKNRGHFLFDSLGNVENGSIKDLWSNFNHFLEENYTDEQEQSPCFECEDIEAIENVLKNKSLGITKKKEELMRLCFVTKKQKQKEEILKAICGASVKLNVLFQDEELKNAEISSFSFKSGFEENEDALISLLGERFELIEKLKALHDWALLSDILNGEKYLCFARVNTYNEHHQDLTLLKQYVKTYCPQKKQLIFNDCTKNGYAHYSRHVSGAKPDNLSQEDFCKFLEKELPENTDELYAEMFAKIKARTFMPKIITKDNGVIPMQVQQTQLEAILNNAQTYLPFLNEKDESGITNKEKIISIFTYRIPYYIGPLNEHSSRHWLERKEGKIYPWNFEQVVDLEKSAENFIQNLTSKCTYLKDKDVLPKSSLLYSKYMVLNELNNLRIDGEKPTVAVKQDIYNNLFIHGSKVTQSKLKKYLIATGVIRDASAEITGIDGDFKSTLKSHKDLSKYSLSTQQKEDIIKDITIFGDDRKLLKKRLKKNYADVLNEEDILAISKLKYKDWGRLSKEFLTELYGNTNKDTGEVLTVIDALWYTNDNLNQILYNKTYGFLPALEEYNKRFTVQSLKEEVESLYISPMVKRPVYQAMKIVNELSKIRQGAPKKIFVEVARGSDGSGRTISRKQNLIELYKACKMQSTELFRTLNEKSEQELKRDALYLYYTQFGKCMYSGEKIDLASLSAHESLYDIDHIYPRSKIKDDSVINNKVLVFKTANQKKDNEYPIKQEIRNKMSGFWHELLQKELITKEKYHRLTRATPLSDDELMSFVNRQLVSTRQSTKAVSELLQKYYPDTKVYYVKAALASEFRKEFDMLKCREVNDLHHAKDAYLNIVVGNVYYTLSARKDFAAGLQNGYYSMNKIFKKDVPGAWVIENGESINTVRRMMHKNNVRFVRYASKQTGGFYKQLPLKKGSGQLVPLKQTTPLNDTNKYGGYDKPVSTYFALVRFTDNKGKQQRRFVPIDLYKEKEYLADAAAFMNKELNTSDAVVEIPCIKYNTLISIDGFRMHISSKSSGGAAMICKPAMQLVIGYENEKYVRDILKYVADCQALNKELSTDAITIQKNISLYEYIIQKLNTTTLKVKFDGIAAKLESRKEVFASLTALEQCKVLLQILNITKCNVTFGDLTLIKEAKKAGLLQISANALTSKSIHSFKIIHQSVTGLYEQQIELLK